MLFGLTEEFKMLQTDGSGLTKLPPIADLDDPDFDPFAGDILSFGDVVDPYSRIRELSQQSWVHPREYRRFFLDRPDPILDKYDFKFYSVFVSPYPYDRDLVRAHHHSDGPA